MGLGFGSATDLPNDLECLLDSLASVPSFVKCMGIEGIVVSAWLWDEVVIRGQWQT